MISSPVSSFLRLNTERLLLRPLFLSDEDEIYFLRTDAEVNRFLDRPAVTSKEEAVAFIRKISAGVENTESFYWGIALKNSERIIGTICLWNLSEENNSAEIGYELMPSMQGNGYMSEAVDEIIKLAFTRLSAGLITAWMDRENLKSARLLEKKHFQRDINAEKLIDRHTESDKTIIYSLKNPGVTYRVAKLSDIPEISSLRLSVRENRLSDPGLISYSDIEEFMFVRGKGWVCEEGNKIVGFAIADLKEDNIWALFIMPGYEGKGIGTRLHAMMLDWYFSDGKEMVWLGTAPKTRAEKFYRKAGWNDAGIRSNGEIRFEMKRSEWSNLKKAGN